MTKKIFAVVAVLCLGGISAADADYLEKGDVEVQFRFSYNKLEFEGGDDTETKEAVGIVGYMLTDRHEIGGGVGYFGVDSTEVLEYGGAYTYNMRAGESLHPYVSLLVLGFGGDRADVFDFGTALELGIKAYPGEHGGMLFGVAYRDLRGADGVPNADQLLAFGGVTLKF